MLSALPEFIAPSAEALVVFTDFVWYFFYSSFHVRSVCVCAFFFYFFSCLFALTLSRCAGIKFYHLLCATMKVQTSLKNGGDRENSINTEHFSWLPLLLLLVLLVLAVATALVVLLLLQYHAMSCDDETTCWQQQDILALHSSTSNAQSFIESTPLFIVHDAASVLYSIFSPFSLSLSLYFTQSFSFPPFG